jgi:hypothetical protein
LVTAAAAAGVLAIVTAPQTGAAERPAKGDVTVTSIDGLRLLPAHPRVAGTNGVSALAVTQNAYLISSVLSGRCLDADTNTIKPTAPRCSCGTAIRTLPTRRSTSRQNAEGYMRFQNVASGRYLYADMNSIGTNGTRVQLWNFVAGAKNQWWSAKQIPEGYLRMQTPASTRCLSVDESVGGNGARVQLWDFIAGSHGQWWQ